VFEEGELKRNSVVANFATTATDGKVYQACKDMQSYGRLCSWCKSKNRITTGFVTIWNFIQRSIS